MSEGKHFNAEKIFAGLFLLTMAEVAWGLFGHGWNKPMLWGGLLFCAFLKGWLIAVYFMHLKFEGWVIYSLLIPTPFLVLVIFGYVMPDVANRDPDNHLVHPIGSQFDPESGRVEEAMVFVPDHGEGADHGGEPAPAGH